ncbi:MAG TPA: hypothetical protein VKR56_16005 [Candidatus Cybelea sp.]|nr:hypothetical protein [Candidatus Cybelea sp.]
MRSITGATAALAALIALQAAGAAQTASSIDLLRRAVNPNPSLQSYTASAQLSATLHVVIPLHENYGGTVYYLKPRRTIHFQNVSGALSRFKDLAASTPTYDEAMAQYTVTPGTDNGNVSTYTFVPKKQGSRVKSITLTVNDASALVSRAQWAYTNRGSMSFDQTYTTVGTFHLPAKADISARFPGYSVDGTLTFGNYNPNAPVSPSVFPKG